MIRLMLTAEAAAAIGADLTRPDPRSDRPGRWAGFGVWIERSLVDRLDAARGPAESYSDTILRLRNEEGRQ